jgi:hypothetical protein
LGTSTPELDGFVLHDRPRKHVEAAGPPRSAAQNAAVALRHEVGVNLRRLTARIASSACSLFHQGNDSLPTRRLSHVWRRVGIVRECPPLGTAAPPLPHPPRIARSGSSLRLQDRRLTIPGDHLRLTILVQPEALVAIVSHIAFDTGRGPPRRAACEPSRPPSATRPAATSASGT